MVFETHEKQYTVLRILTEDEHISRYVCQDESDQSAYLVFKIHEKDWIVKTLSFLTDQVNNRDFSDMVSCFFCEESLFIVMRKAEGTTLEEKLSDEECSMTERIAMGRSILDKLMIQNMPEYFMKDCLNTSAILMSHSLQAGFCYNLNNLYDYGEVVFQDVCNRIADIMNELFKYELKKRILSVMDKFIKDLTYGEFKDILSVYKEYDEVCKKIAGMTAEELNEPKTWPFRLWDRFKKIWPGIKRVIALALLVAALVFLAITIKNIGNEGNENKSFSYIGTLTIK